MDQNLFQPKYLKALCEEFDLLPSRSYGQHFLIVEKFINDMVEAANLQPTDSVVEIGPGFGPLTLAMAPKVKKIFAFEIEQKLRSYWDNLVIENPNVEMVWGNVLQEWQSVGDQLSATSYKVVANLPYQITSDVIRLFFETSHKPHSLTIMVQKEVADRMCAKAGDMSLLSVVVQFYGEPSIISRVPAGAFWPRPKVDSAIVSIRNIDSAKYLAIDANEFLKVVRAGFAHPRKQLIGNLSAGLHIDKSVVANALRDIKNDEKVRAEELSVDEWVQLYQFFQSP